MHVFEGVFGDLLLLVLFVCQAYCLIQVFSNTHESRIRKFRWLGPFALVVPGALNSKGRSFLVVFVTVSAALMALGTHLFAVP